MNSIFKTAIFFSCLYVISSCSKIVPEEGTCSDTSPNFRILDLESYPRYVDSSDNEFTPIENDTVYYEDFSWAISFNTTGFDANARIKKLSCPEPGYEGDTIGLKNIFITTQYDFNDSISQGDTINDVIRINDMSFHRITPPFSEDYKYPLDDYLINNKDGITHQAFDLWLTIPPYSLSDQLFNLIYILNNGETFTVNSGLIKFE